MTQPDPIAPPGRRIADAAADLVVLAIFVLGAFGSNLVGQWFEHRSGELTFLQHAPLWGAEVATAAGSLVYSGQIIWYRILKPVIGFFKPNGRVGNGDDDDDSGGGGALGAEPKPAPPSVPIKPRRALEDLGGTFQGSALTLPSASVAPRFRRSLAIGVLAGVLSCLTLLIVAAFNGNHSSTSSGSWSDDPFLPTLAIVSITLVSTTIVELVEKIARAAGVSAMRAAISMLIGRGPSD